MACGKFVRIMYTRGKRTFCVLNSLNNKNLFGEGWAKSSDLGISDTGVMKNQSDFDRSIARKKGTISLLLSFVGYCKFIIRLRIFLSKASVSGEKKILKKTGYRQNDYTSTYRQ